MGPTELLIILGIALLLFGGSRLAGLGKGVGRSIKEFKQEVKSVDDGKDPEVVDAEIVHTDTSHESDQERRIREIEARERDLQAREALARDESLRQHGTGTGI
ncbi:MAG: twin-arginine translocase TatA/TatE family subunit [Arachnia sp.]